MTENAGIRLQTFVDFAFDRRRNDGLNVVERLLWQLFCQYEFNTAFVQSNFVPDDGE